MKFAFVILFPSEKRINDIRRDVELVEDFGLFLDGSAFYEFVDSFFCEDKCHEVLLDGILVGEEMNVAHSFGIETDETEVELFHAWNISLQGFNDDVLATWNIGRAF